MIVMVKNAGIASVIRPKFISLIDDIIITPIVTSAPVSADSGIRVNIGARKSANKNNTPVVKAVSPVLPPSAIPAELSTNVVMVEVPSVAPSVVPIASDIRASFDRGILPFLSNILACFAAPISVPSVLNRSINARRSIITIISGLSSALKSNLKNIGSIESGVEIGLKSAGRVVAPVIIETTVQIIIDRKRAPFSFRCTNTPHKMIPNSEISIGLLKLPCETSVAELPTITSPFCSPIKAIKKPRPAGIAMFSEWGIALIIFSRMLNAVSRINNIPSTKVIVSAVCHE